MCIKDEWATPPFWRKVHHSLLRFSELLPIRRTTIPQLILNIWPIAARAFRQLSHSSESAQSYLRHKKISDVVLPAKKNTNRRSFVYEKVAMETSAVVVTEIKSCHSFISKILYIISDLVWCQRSIQRSWRRRREVQLLIITIILMITALSLSSGCCAVAPLSLLLKNLSCI